MATASNPAWRYRRFGWLPMAVGAVVLVAGIIAFVIARWGLHTNEAVGPRVGTGKLAVAKPQKTVKVDSAARLVAGKFVLSTVGRNNLAQGWKLITPKMRKDCACTYKEWLTGNINVVPFPAKDIAFAPFKTDWSYKSDIGLEVALLSKNNKSIKSQIFFIELKKQHGKWLVDYIAPRGGGIQVPNTNNG